MTCTSSGCREMGRYLLRYNCEIILTVSGEVCLQRLCVGWTTFHLVNIAGQCSLHSAHTRTGAWGAVSLRTMLQPI